MPFLLCFAALLATACDQATESPVRDSLPAAKSDSPVATKPQQTKPVSAKSSDKRLYPLTDLAQTTIGIGKRNIKSWVMDTDGKIQEGMMWLSDSEVPNDQAMLFVFEEEGPRSFWMQNTLIPLDIVFIGANKRVVDIKGGKPLDEKSLRSLGPAKYVLELKAGSTVRFELKKGDMIRIPNDVDRT